MATGDDALAAGMDVVDPSTDLVKDGGEEINKTRDYLAQRTAAVTPIANGGTGVTNAAAALIALGAVPVADVYPGTGSVANLIPKYDSVGRLIVATPSASNEASPKAYTDTKLPLAGGTVTGHIYVPNATAATSGYTVAYINGDGRISQGASTERVKKYISQIEPAILGDLFPGLFRFQMRQGDGSWKFGYIAERLAESDALRPFVVWETAEDGRTLALDDDGNPVPLSIDFISLLLAQVAQLHVRVRALESRTEA
jgi:hypothetical protein